MTNSNLTEEIEVIFSTPKKFIFSSFLLKTKFFGMGTPFSHTCLKIKSKTYKRTIIYEAGGNGILAIEFSNWQKKNKIVYSHEFKVSLIRKREIIGYCIDHLGIRYGWWTIIFLWLRDKLDFVINRGIDGTKSLICSEFAYLMLKEEVDELYSQKDRDLPNTIDEMHPRELYNALREIIA